LNRLGILLLAGLVLLLGPAPARAELPARLVNRWGLEFILVPAGRYTVCGGPEVDEQPGREVELAAFYLQATELTQAQWQALTGDKLAARFANPGPDNPADQVSHGDALSLAARLNELAGQPLYGLPREAEWEAACRAGGESLALSPEALTAVAWFRANSGGQSHLVGRLAPNTWGFFDMLGNVYEWCSDSYTPRDCPGRPAGDPNDSTRGLYKVLRGGSFHSLPPLARCGWRFFYDPPRRHPEIGLRLRRAARPLLPGEEPGTGR